MDAAPFSFRKILARVIPLLVLAILAAFLTWDYCSTLDLLAVMGVLFLVLFLNALVAVSAAECRKSSLIGGISAICLYLLAATIIYCFAATTFSSFSYNKAKSYPAQAMPFIEQYHQSRGDYPDHLAEVPGLPRAPQGIVYHRWPNEPGYVFNFNEYSFGAHGYSSETKAWYPND
jgi:hypothetical protein